MGPIGFSVGPLTRRRYDVAVRPFWWSREGVGPGTGLHQNGTPYRQRAKKDAENGRKTGEIGRFAGDFSAL